VSVTGTGVLVDVDGTLDDTPIGKLADS